MENSHQESNIKRVSDDFGVGLSESVFELSKKFSENTDEVKRLADLVHQEKKDKHIERPFEMLFIPSRGLFYPSKENFLLLNQLTYVEENLLTSEFLVDSGRAMDFVLKNVLVEQNINPSELLAGDVHAISLFLRSFAYGDKFDVDLDCAKCGNSDNLSIRLSSFQMKDMLIPPVDGLIPMLLDGTDLLFRFKPNTYFEDIAIEKKKLSSLDKLIFMTHSINGCEDKLVISSVLRRLSLSEIRRVKKYLDKVIPGVDAKINHSCSSCQHVSTYDFGGAHNFLSFPPSFRENVNEECFLVAYYGRGVDYESVKRMSVTERRWILNRINEEMTKKREAEEKASRSSKGRR